MLSSSIFGIMGTFEEVTAANGNFGGGDGSETNPYIIEDVWDLQNMSFNLTAYYFLGNDIDANITSTWNGGKGFEPIGNITSPFRGSFDGRGYNITGLYINRPDEDYIGLFGSVGHGGTVHDFDLKDANITGRNYTGTVAGHTSDENITQRITLPESPAAYWKMDEAYWNGTPGEVIDSSGNGNDGTALNGANTTTGKYDRAGNFDGTDDYVETGKTATDLGINGANPRTIMFWVYTRSFNNGGVYECGDYLTDQDFSFRTLDTDDNWRVQLIADDIDFTYPSLNTWVHFAIVYDGTDVIVYADGTEITRAAKSLNTADTHTFKMGEWSGAYFDGLIDELAIYDRALTPSEIAQSYFFHSADALYNINAYGDISGSNHTGGLIGSMELGIDVSYSGFFGSVRGYRYVGGIAGMAGSDIDHDTFSGNATAASMDVGGIAGSNSENITNCQAKGNITGYQENAGGISGGSTGTISSCTFTGNITASGYDTGGIVGENHGGTVDSCQAHANIESPYRTGGLVGTSWDGGTITNSHAYGNVSGTDMIGGLVGKSQDSTVENSHAYSNLTGTGSMLGGLIGYLLRGNVSASYSDGYVYGGNSTGGLVGYGFSSTIQSSISRATVSGHDMVGGVVGMVESRSIITGSKSTTGTVEGNNYTAGVVGYASDSNITRCYSGSAIRGNTWVGGVTGYILDGNITDCYSMSEIHATDIAGGIAGELNSSNSSRCYFTRPIDSPGTRGAIVGINGGSIYSAFADNETITGCPYIGSGNTSGVIARNTTDMLNQATYTGGWNFSGVWWMFSGMTRPFLRTEMSTEIYDDHELQLLRLSTVSFTVHRDIYISGDKNWSMWGNVGSFLKIPSANRVDGGGYYIHNLRMTGMEGVGGSPTDNYAFIGQAYSDVIDLHIVNASIHVPNSGTYPVKYVGGLVGYMDSGYIIQCSFEGNISRDPVSVFEDFMTGGLVGGVRSYFPHTVNIYDSMFRGSIDGAGHVGGLTGIFHPDDWVEVIIENSYVIGDIRQNSNIWPTNTGGLIGVLVPGRGITATIRNCYFTGTLEPVSGYTSPIVSTQDGLEMLPLVMYTYYHTSSNFDVYTGYPLTQEEMTHSSSFYKWDFTSSWRIQENHTYPYLSWERNYPVHITSPDSLPNATQNAYYSVKFNSTDGNPTDVRPLWTIDTNASWLHISQNGTLYGTPGPYDVGTCWVNITVADARGSTDYRNLTITVINVNDPPTITTSDITTATQDSLYSVTYNATDPDNDTLTWSLSTNAPWLSVTNSTISGIPTNADVGTYWVNISVSDGNGGTDCHNFTLTVKNVNDPPTITTTDLTTAVQDEMYSVEYSATDPDGDTLIWAMQTSASWLTLSGPHLWGTSTNDNVGTYWVNISVSDGNGGTDHHNFTLTVQNVNDLPSITTTDMTTATQDSLYSVGYSAIDPDGDSLTWSLSTAAKWLSLTNSTISGTPTNADVGTYWVNISVSDGNGGIDYQNFSLTVKNINDPPAIGNFTVPEGTTEMEYSLLITATDPDGDALMWFMSAPSWLSMNSSTGLITGTPREAGNFSVSVTVSDGNGGTDTASFSIYITADSDGDGVNNTDDAYPFDPTRWDPPVQYNNETIYHNETIYNNETVHINRTVWAPIEDTYLNDTDGDGMPDSWELLYGLNPNSSADASQDKDGDGITNLQEYEGGTSPIYPNIQESTQQPAAGTPSVILPSILALLLGILIGALIISAVNRRTNEDIEDGEPDEDLISGEQEPEDTDAGESADVRENETEEL